MHTKVPMHNHPDRGDHPDRGTGAGHHLRLKEVIVSCCITIAIIMSEEYGLTSPPRHIQLVKRSTVPERQNSSRKAYCRERKSSGEIAAVSNRGA